MIWKIIHYWVKCVDGLITDCYNCYGNDTVYGSCKDLIKTTESDKVLRNKVFKIASDPRYDGYQRELALTFF